MIRQSKSQPNYKLGKKILESTPISNTYNIQNSATQQIWKAKVFDLTKIDEYNMLNVLQYNEEVFTFLKDKYENSLYIENTFQKDSKQFVVYEYWNQRLSDYICKHPQGIKDQHQVKRILQDVLMSICDIYAESYMILNLRPDNIVRVQQPTQNSMGWKIQSLVFQYTTYGLPQKCQYEFDYEWASNEEKDEKQNLDDTLKDQQIVWYIGILALRLIYGPKFRINKKFKDSDFNLSEIKRISLPQIHELVEKSVRSNLKDRIPLKKFLNLSVFSKVQISSQVKDKFISGNSERIKKSSIMKGSILQKSINRKNSDSFKMSVSSRIQQPAKPITQNSRMKNSLMKTSQLSEVKAQKIFNQLRWVLEKCLYFGEIKDYTQTTASLSETSAQDKTLVRYLYFKIGEVNLKRFKEMISKWPNLKTFRQSMTSKDLYQDLLDQIEQNEKSKEIKSILDESIEYENKMRKVDPNQLKILSEFKYIASNIKKNIQSKKTNIEELVDYFSIINGKFFTSLKILIQNTYGVQNKGIKIRALCYFIISSYVLLVKPLREDDEEELAFLLKNDFSIYKKQFYEPQRLQGSIHVKFADQVEYIRLCEFTKTSQEDPLIQNSKHILQKYFRNDQLDQKPLPIPEKETKIRTSLKVPVRNNY